MHKLKEDMIKYTNKTRRQAHFQEIKENDEIDKYDKNAAFRELENKIHVADRFRNAWIFVKNHPDSPKSISWKNKYPEKDLDKEIDKWTNIIHDYINQLARFKGIDNRRIIDTGRGGKSKKRKSKKRKSKKRKSKKRKSKKH